MPEILDRCRQAMTGDPRVTIICDAGSPVAPRLPTVEVIARLALTARSHGQVFRLVGCGPPLLGLLDLCGIADAVGAADCRGTPARSGLEARGQPEQREEPLGIEEEGDAGNPS